MTDTNQSFENQEASFPASERSSAFPEPHIDRWPLAARASLVMSLCGLFWGLLGAAVLHLASR